MVIWLFREETHHDAATAATRSSRQELEDHQHGDELQMCFCAWGTSFSLLWELLLMRFSSFFYLLQALQGSDLSKEELHTALQMVITNYGQSI
jgi:hypothetical protein